MFLVRSIFIWCVLVAINFQAGPDVLVILGGPPGAGKTTLLNALKKHFSTNRAVSFFNEVPRQVIKEGLEAANCSLIPWCTRFHVPQFRAEIDMRLQHQLERMQEIDGGLCIIDRSPVDTYSYRVRALVHDDLGDMDRYWNDPSLKDIWNLSCRYLTLAQKVIVYYLPNWPKIYVNDEIRRESPQEAERADRAIVRAYGYFYTQVPFKMVNESVNTTVTQRVAKVLHLLSASA